MKQETGDRIEESELRRKEIEFRRQNIAYNILVKD